METVKQGQVFWFGENIKQNFGQSNINLDYIIQGRRPHIVISDNIINDRGKICTIVPCTTNLDVENKYHIKLKVFEDRYTIALCDQMISVNQSELLENEMICQLDDKYINQILFGCANTLGLINSVVECDSVKTSLEQLETKIFEITESIIRKQTNNFTTNFVNDITKRISQQISSSFETTPPINLSEAKPLDNTADIPMDNDHRYILPRNEKTGRIKWSDGLYHKFLDDYRNLDIDEVMHKWNLSTRQKAHELKYRAIHRYDRYS